MTLGELTTLVDAVTADDGTWTNWATPVGRVMVAVGVTYPSGWRALGLIN